MPLSDPSVEINYCELCKFESGIVEVEYGETTSLGHAIMIPNCYAELYRKDLDQCVCGNFIPKVKQWRTWECWIMTIIDFRYWFCLCHYHSPYGKVVSADCEIHD